MTEALMTQSTNHLFMIEPAVFYANPETMPTNAYQIDGHEHHDAVFQRALSELRGFRDNLVAHGVMVTTAKGFQECPDMVFPNWASTHAGGQMILYPMLNANRQAERDPAIIKALSKAYPEVIDWTGYEKDGLCLEARSSIVSDRVNKRGFAALSQRTSRELVDKWADFMGYEIEVFHTRSHTGGPVYHTDLVIWIGSTLAGVCSECIVEEDRERIVKALQSTHEVVEFDNAQLRSFCGNALEVTNREGKRILVLSDTAEAALNDNQRAVISQHFDTLIHSPLDTLETYGGGSARCCLMELY
ncbi:MAG: amidinotransferase [Alphaproteobacteria bacterium]|nr:amidinotransferase [Alphaproteobacteria bacterium]